MNTKQFQYVLTLVREGSFSKAAEALNISQPSLSQYIKKIEREVGLELFDRTNGEVKITDAGRIYIEAGQRILAIEHQMENAFTDLAEHKSGSLIIGVAPYRAAGMMPTIAAAFKKLYPGVHLVVREGTTAELIEGMEHGTYDLALSLLPVDDQLFFCEKVMEEELVLAVPSGAARNRHGGAQASGCGGKSAEWTGNGDAHRDAVYAAPAAKNDARIQFEPASRRCRQVAGGTDRDGQGRRRTGADAKRDRALLQRRLGALLFLYQPAAQARARADLAKRSGTVSGGGGSETDDLPDGMVKSLGI